MTRTLWQFGAVELAEKIRSREVSALQATQQSLARIDEVNPRINALVDLMRDEALDAARAADQALSQGRAVGPLHGVPIAIKVNVDTAGRATTDGIVASRDKIAAADSPLVTNLRAAGAVIVGRSNTPAFSVRWFTDNDLHGRTLNPFDPNVTPGGSSGGAAAALACGMVPLAHGNDYGGSIRYPAFACGVVGLRPTIGRVPSYKATTPSRFISSQMMSVNGPMTRSVKDARVALEVMSHGSPLDPQWVPAPLQYPDSNRSLQGFRVAMFKHHPAFEVDPSVVEAVERAAGWLADAGCPVDEIEPPNFEEATQIWRQLVMEDMRIALPAIESMADRGTRSAVAGYLADLPELDRRQLLEMQMRRLDICREWEILLEQYAVLLMPNSWQRQFPIDADVGPPEKVHQLLAAQSPLLAIAMMGLPGLSVPTGLASGLPAGVQIVAARFREDRALRAGELIERAAGFDVLDAIDHLN